MFWRSATPRCVGGSVSARLSHPWISRYLNRWRAADQSLRRDRGAGCANTRRRFLPRGDRPPVGGRATDCHSLGVARARDHAAVRELEGRRARPIVRGGARRRRDLRASTPNSASTGHRDDPGDLESRNGSFVNGVRCSDGAIAIGDVVRCGEWIGVSVCEAEGSDADSARSSPGWFGGAVLRAAVAPARRIAGDLPISSRARPAPARSWSRARSTSWSAARRPFVAVNCAALPEQLVEAELFGHRKGAFTGADAQQRRAVPQPPSGGTLFLDEIGDLPLRAAGQAAARARGARGARRSARRAPCRSTCASSPRRRSRSRARLPRARSAPTCYARLDGLTVRASAAARRGARTSRRCSSHS